MNRQKYVVLLVVALVVFAANSGAAKSSRAETEAFVDKLWIHRIGKWHKAPRDSDSSPRFRSSLATLIRFSENHEFSLMHCWVTEYKGRLEISPGDGQMIFLGTWNEGASGIETRLRLVYETVQPVPHRPYPGPEELEKARIVGKEVEFKGKWFVEATTLDVEDYEGFIRPERAKLKPDQAAPDGAGRDHRAKQQW